MLLENVKNSVAMWDRKREKHVLKRFIFFEKRATIEKRNKRKNITF